MQCALLPHGRLLGMYAEARREKVQGQVQDVQDVCTAASQLPIAADRTVLFSAFQCCEMWHPNMKTFYNTSCESGLQPAFFLEMN